MKHPEKKDRKKPRRAKVDGFKSKSAKYQPTKAELEEDLSVPVSLERLAKAAVKGGATRQV